MAVDLSTSPGGLFRRIGRCGGTLLSENAWRGPTLGSSIDFIAAQFDSTLQHVTDRLYSVRDSARNAMNGLARSLASLAEFCLIEQVNADNALAQKTKERALEELIRQMEDNAQNVLANTVTAVVVADSSNVSDAQIIVSVLNRRGQTLENIIPEVIEVTCTTDSQGNATLGREQLVIEGEQAQTNLLAHDWPLGSGASLTLNAASADTNASSGHSNHQTNSDFEDFTSNLPDNWVASAGTAGVDIFEETSVVYRGDSSLRLRGDGSTKVGVNQVYNSPTGTTKKLLPLTVYAVNCWVRMSAVPAAGVLALELIDGNNAVLAKWTGAPNQLTKNLTGVGTTWVPFQGFFHTPAVLPTTYKLRVHQLTAVESGKSVYVDDLVMVQAQPAYDSGPYFGCFSGASKLIVGDRWLVTVDNSAPDQSWNRIFDRFFDMKSLQMQLPASGIATLPASWIVPYP